MKLIEYKPYGEKSSAWFAADKFVKISNQPPLDYEGAVCDKDGRELTFITLINEIVVATDLIGHVIARLNEV